MGRPARGPNTAEPRGNVTAARAIDLLSLFDDQHPVISAGEAAKALGMSRSTTYRYLQSLRAAGLVEDDETSGGLRLGPRVLQLAAIARASWDLGAVAVPVMRRLTEATRETTVLTRRTGDHVICVEEVRSPNPIRLSYERGRVLPVHAGASAKVLIAWLAGEELTALLERTQLRDFTGATVTSEASLRQDLERIRARGYAITRGEVDAGVLGVAAPIFRRSGEVVAGLSVVAPEYRVAEGEVDGLVALTLEAATELTRRVVEHDV
ncbi:MAG TPA: IclR family transcriptional regulator [Acidimicrobiales bacterium]|nr:IclR family transcriptional regulator [Acidimicrobiales bacterium]